MRAISLPLGADVYTADNDKLGTVKAIEGEFFQVQARGLHQDYWLAAECATFDPLGGRVDVTFHKDDLKGRKQHIEEDLLGRASVFTDKDPRALRETVRSEPEHPADQGNQSSMVRSQVGANQAEAQQSDFVALLLEFAVRLDNTSPGNFLALKAGTANQREAVDAIERIVTKLREYEQLVR